jgi:hypothetical protein
MGNATQYSGRNTASARTRRHPHRIDPVTAPAAPPPPTNIDRLRDELHVRDELRATLKTMTFREGGGGGYTPDICSVCQEDRHGEEWIGRKGDPGRMCGRCWDEGYYPGETRGSERKTVAEARASADRGHKPKSPARVRVYVLRPIQEGSRDNAPGASFSASPERAARLAGLKLICLEASAPRAPASTAFEVLEERARGARQRAVEEARAHRIRGEALEALNRTAEAAAAYETALKIDPNVGAKRKLSALRKRTGSSVAAL